MMGANHSTAWILANADSCRADCLWVPSHVYLFISSFKLLIYADRSLHKNCIHTDFDKRVLMDGQDLSISQSLSVHQNFAPSISVRGLHGSDFGGQQRQHYTGRQSNPKSKETWIGIFIALLIVDWFLVSIHIDSDQNQCRVSHTQILCPVFEHSLEWS